MNKVVVIVGPTGIGKTKLSIELAKFLNSEVINGDAFQIYKGMDIGTAKVTEEEKDGVPHHLFDICEVDETFSAFDYQIKCREKLKELHDKNIIPVIVGGTGLYLKCALYDYKFVEESNPIDMSEYEKLDNQSLYNKLLELDEEAAKKTHPNNRRRVMRSLQICLSVEGNKSDLIASQEHKLLYDVKFVGLETSREVLYDRCNRRVDIMLDQGLEKEVRDLYEKYKDKKNLTSFQAIDYKEFFDYFEGKMSKEEAIELVKKNTRNYVKRQYTWFKRQVDATWYDVNFEDFSQTVRAICDDLKEWSHE